MKLLTLILKISLSFIFLLLFYRGISDFDMNYFKFQLVDVINENKIGKVFYVLIVLQLFLGVAIFFNNRIVQRIYSICLLAYTSFISAFLLYIYYYYGGCIMCSYKYYYFNEGIKGTIIITILLLPLYLFIVYLQQRLNNKQITDY